MSIENAAPIASRVSGRPRTAATLILASIGAFVTSLDVVVVSTALPQLRLHLGASLSDLEWTINAYNLAFASLMLTGAALGDRFGRKKLYVIGLLLFTASSIACATAGSAGALITARAVQGAGGAALLCFSAIEAARGRLWHWNHLQGSPEGLRPGPLGHKRDRCELDKDSCLAHQYRRQGRTRPRLQSTRVGTRRSRRGHRADAAR